MMLVNVTGLQLVSVSSRSGSYCSSFSRPAAVRPGSSGTCAPLNSHTPSRSARVPAADAALANAHDTSSANGQRTEPSLSVSLRGVAASLPRTGTWSELTMASRNFTKPQSR